MAWQFHLFGSSQIQDTIQNISFMVWQFHLFGSSQIQDTIQNISFIIFETIQHVKSFKILHLGGKKQHLSHIDNAIAADDLARQRARASTAMV